MNLETTYMGLKLKNPLVPASAPFSKNIDSLKRLEDAGASAVTLFSLFEEQIEHETEMLAHYLDYGADSYAEATSYFPTPQQFHKGPDEYLELIAQAKRHLHVPVIASLNGVSTGGWVEYARLMQEAGAAAIELNVYWIETDPDISGTEVEARYVEVVETVVDTVRIPVAVKIGPYFSAPGNMACRLARAGAKGLVLFNRFYEPDFNIELREVSPKLQLSSSGEMRLPLHWIAILYGRIEADLALTTGVHTAHDVVRAMMAGAKVATMASALLEHGPEYLAKVLDDLAVWLDEHGYESVRQMQGSMSYRKVANPAAFERANYMKELQSFRPQVVPGR